MLGLLKPIDKIQAENEKQNFPSLLLCFPAIEKAKGFLQTKLLI
jgi:hypothetical protein